MDKGNKIRLGDMLDIDFLQEFQDIFAKALNVASLTVDDKGPITKPSNFTEFCIKYTRGSKEGLKRCNNCDITWGKVAAEKGEPIIYTCHSGLTDFAVPIMVSGEHIASILGGQILTKVPDEEHFRNLARELNIDEEEYIKSVRKIKVLPIKQVEAAAQLFFIVANAMSKLASKQYELKLKREREEALYKITEKIRSSLNLDETLEYICEETAKIFNADRSTISKLNQEGKLKLIFQKEYKQKQEVQGATQLPNYETVSNYWGNILAATDGPVSFNDIEKSTAPDFFKENYSQIGIKSTIGIGIKREGSMWGALVLANTSKTREWDENEKYFLKLIANQTFIAIQQAELFEKIKKTAENERTLREIMLASVSSFDIKEIIKSIVTKAGELLHSDRCFFVEIDWETFSSRPIKEYAEYLSSSDILSHSKYTPTKAETGVFVTQLQKQHAITVNNVEKADLPQVTKNMLLELGVKSYLIAPIYYGEKVFGSIVYHYVRGYKEFTEEEINISIAVANQSAVIIHQAELFELTKIQAEREKISKNIIEILRSTFDKNIIKKLFVKNIGNFLNADQVIFSEYNKKLKSYDPVDRDSEYLSSDTKSLIGVEWNKPEIQELIKPLIDRREFHIFNWEEYMKSNARSQDFIDFFETRDIKSSYSFPVMYQQEIIGFFSINYIKKSYRLSDEDINRIRTICTQAGIAIHHANLYKNAQKSIQAHTEFVDKFSKEVKSVIDLIISFSEIVMKEDKEYSEEVKNLSIINTNARKLRLLVDDIVTEYTIFDYD